MPCTAVIACNEAFGDLVGGTPVNLSVEIRHQFESDRYQYLGLQYALHNCRRRLGMIF